MNSNADTRIAWGACFALILPLIGAYCVHHFYGFNPTKSYASAIFVVAIWLWIGELLPVAITALMLPVLMVLSGVASTEQAFTPFSNGIILIFIAAFFLGLAFHKHHLDQRIAFWMLSKPRLASTPNRLVMVFGVLSFVLSMWMSNTATVAMLTPLALSLLGIFPHSLSNQRLSIFLLLTIAYCASIGGIATPIGSPTNLIVIGFLRRAGIDISFFQWLSFGLPIAATMLLCTFGFMRWRFSSESGDSSIPCELRANLVARYQEMGPVSRAQWQVGGCFLLTVALWILPDLIALFADPLIADHVRKRLPLSVAAMIGVCPMFLMRATNERTDFILSWNDAKHIDWGTVILFGGGLSLGAMLEYTGLARDISANLFSGATQHLWALALIAGGVTLLFTEVSSNIASASIFLGVMGGFFGETLTVDQIAPFLMIGLVSSFGFMMPIATPPNAIIFATGRVPLTEMLKTGAVLNLIGLILVAVFLLVFAVQRISIT